MSQPGRGGTFTLTGSAAGGGSFDLRWGLSGSRASGLRRMGACSHCSSSITSMTPLSTSEPSAWMMLKAWSATRWSSRIHRCGSLRTSRFTFDTNSRLSSCLSPDRSHARSRSLGVMELRSSICCINIRRLSTDSNADGSTSQAISASSKSASGGTERLSARTTSLRARASKAWR